MSLQDTTQRISPKDLSRIFLECHENAGSASEFIDMVVERTGYVFTRYILAAIYYAIKYAVAEHSVAPPK